MISDIPHFDVTQTADGAHLVNDDVEIIVKARGAPDHATARTIAMIERAPEAFRQLAYLAGRLLPQSIDETDTSESRAARTWVTGDGATWSIGYSLGLVDSVRHATWYVDEDGR